MMSEYTKVAAIVVGIMANCLLGCGSSLDNAAKNKDGNKDNSPDMLSNDKTIHSSSWSQVNCGKRMALESNMQAWNVDGLGQVDMVASWDWVRYFRSDDGRHAVGLMGNGMNASILLVLRKADVSIEVGPPDKAGEARIYFVRHGFMENPDSIVASWEELLSGDGVYGENVFPVVGEVGVDYGDEKCAMSICFDIQTWKPVAVNERVAHLVVDHLKDELKRWAPQEATSNMIRHAAQKARERMRDIEKLLLDNGKSGHPARFRGTVKISEWRPPAFEIGPLL